MVLLFQLNAHMVKTTTTTTTTTTKNKKQIKCVKERALGDKAEVCEASFEELGIHLNVLIHYVVLSK